MNQEQWDAQLIDAFYNAKDAPVWRLLCGENLDNFSALLRVPEAFDLNKTVTHFIASKIPKLSSILWSTDKSKSPNIINALKKSKLDTSKRAIGRNEQEKRERRIERNIATKGYFLSGEIRRHATLVNATDWKTCK